MVTLVSQLFSNADGPMLVSEGEISIAPDEQAVVGYLELMHPGAWPNDIFTASSNA